jgi:hypothetical protein
MLPVWIKMQLFAQKESRVRGEIVQMERNAKELPIDN